MALTPDQRDYIVELRLEGRTVREVVAQTGHGSGTVSRVWHAYLAETSQDRRPELGLRREELLQRFERNAADARLGATIALDAEDHSAATRYLAAELSALRRVVELEGLLAGNSHGVTPRSTVEDPVPWRDAAEALALRVAVVEVHSAENRAMNALLSTDTLTLGTPTTEELLPAVLESLAELDAGDPDPLDGQAA